MSMSCEFNVGTVWDDDQLRQWASWSGGSDSRVTAVFGCRQRQLVGHGRAPGDVPAVADSAILRHAKVARSVGIEFLYLFNGLCTHLDFRDEDTKKRFMNDLEWVVEEVRADALVVADPRLAALIRGRYSPDQIRIRVSTIAAIQTIDQLRTWIPFHVDGIVLHHDVGRNFSRLCSLIDWLRHHAPNVNLELLVNESCVPHCLARQAHYAHLACASEHYVEGFQQNCNIPRFLDPTFILSARWIRPEDLSAFCDLGIRRFKIAGREMDGRWLNRAVKAYLKKEHNGNLVELFTMTPPGLDVAASDIVYINNCALNGFLQQLKGLGDTSFEAHHAFYHQWARKLFENGDLLIHDPESVYLVENGRLRCKNRGRYLKALLDQRVNSSPPFHPPRKQDCK